MSTDNHIGRVYKKAANAYHIDLNGRPVVCSLATRLSKELDTNTTDPVAIGDRVEIDADERFITGIEPRSSKLSRPDPGPKPLEQIIAANLDQVVTVFAAARPEPKWNLLDRYIVSAEAVGLPVVIAITKMDLGDVGKIDAEMEVYQALGYRVVLTSADTGAGVDEFRAMLTGMISVLVGKSGVGKSSLLNAVQPGLGTEVGQVSGGKFGKGKHTTTGSEMFPLDGGGYLIDTPGIRQFGLWDVEEDDLGVYFREIEPLLGQCKFGLNCAHQREPGCAVREAVAAGEITQRRYDSYLRLQAEES
jgi:ribosome biogenesis GTPase